MKRYFAAWIVAASAIFAPVPVAYSVSNGVIPEAHANNVIQEAHAADVKASGLGVAVIGSFNSGLPMQGSFDRERETTSWLNPKATAPSISWVVALGFLSLIILRRTRSSPMS